MKRMKQKFSSILMTLVMVISIVGNFGMTTLASESTDLDATEPSTEVTVLEENTESDPGELIEEVSTSEGNVIEEVVISNLPKAVLGETIQKGEGSDEFSITVPEGAYYTATAYWDYPTEDGDVTFQSGKTYTLRVNVYANDGFKFADDVILFVDGVAHNYDSWLAPGLVFETSLTYKEATSFCEPISKVEVTGVTKPELGATPDVSGLKVPDGANYYIAEAVWKDSDSYQDATVFEAGHEYNLDIKLIPNAGFEFASNLAAFLEGKDTLVYDSYLGDGGIHIHGGYYSFKDVLTEVKVDNVPEIKVGETTKTEVTVPEGAKYTASIRYGVWDDELQGYEPFTGTFEAGKSYEMVVYVRPAEGYCFNYKQTAVYINGKADTAEVLSGAIYYGIEYSSDVEVIDRVDFSVTVPVPGMHVSIPPEVNIVDGENYSIDEDSLDWFEYDGETIMLAQDYIEAGKRYAVGFRIVADEGYIFSDDLVVVVNGVVVDIEGDYVLVAQKTVSGEFILDAECSHDFTPWTDKDDSKHSRKCTVCNYVEEVEHVYDNASDTTCNVCGHVVKKEQTTATTTEAPTTTQAPTTTTTTTNNTTPSDGAPKTGDNSNIMMVFALMLVCGAGMITLGARQKKNSK